MARFFRIYLLLAAVAGALFSCVPDAAQQRNAASADSLYISVRSVSTVSGLIDNNFLLPGQKRTQYKLEYISETWPDTITPAQANKLVSLTSLSENYNHLLSLNRSLHEKSLRQLEQLKKLNQAINSGVLDPENTLQYLNFESKCADTLNRVLDTLVKRSIDLSCKSLSL